MAPSQCRPCEPRPAQGDVGDRELPHGGARRPCRALRGLRPHARSPTTPAATGTARSARARRPRTGWPTREADLLPVPYYPRRVHAAGGDRRHRLPEQGRRSTICCSRPRPRRCSRSRPTPSTSAPASASPRCCTPGARRMTHHPHVHMIVPGGGISLDGERWIACRPGFFLPVRVLSRLFRRLFLEKLLAAHQAGRLQFFGDHAALADAQAFAAYLAPLRRSRMGRLCQAAVRRARGRAGLSVALHPPRRHLQQPADRLRPQRRHLHAGRTTASKAAIATRS